MADKNQIVLVGKVGSAVKRDKTQNGDGYLAFLLEIQAKETANSSTNNYHQFISVRVFRAPVIKYLDKVGIHLGMPLIVFGFISSYQGEVKGKKIIANSVNGVEVYAIQTRPYND